MTLAFLLTGCAEQSVVQPVQFNHFKHTQENGLTCDFCHKTYSTAEVSGRPGIAICSMCHSASMGKGPEAEKVHGYVERGEEIPWLRLYRVPEHVRYSHVRHVVVAELPCEGCHGAIAETKTPPAGPLVDLTMDFCLSCHRERGATTDCIACHR